ncbi:MAG: acyl-CoA thioesterase [Pseudomonadota bacterium]
MYPIVRVIKEYLRARRMPALEPLGTHVSHHRCWPQDIDNFLEMNNGRILTILDIGRTGLATRVGLINALARNRWALTMAGCSVRYRMRIRPFAKFRILSRALGWDARFFYVEQSIWVGSECAVQVLYRSAVTDKKGIIPPAQVFADVGHDGAAPNLPAWAQNWIDADNTRPWPPTHDGTS